MPVRGKGNRHANKGLKMKTFTLSARYPENLSFSEGEISRKSKFPGQVCILPLVAQGMNPVPA